MGGSRKNPHDICTWWEEKKCAGCEIKGKLNCRYDKKLRALFTVNHVHFRIIIFLGLAYVGLITSNWWFFIAYLVGFVLNFGLVETRYLCRHCPFYAEEGRVLHCIALYGIPKPWKYDPGPLTGFDRFLQVIFGGFVDIFPLPVFLYGTYYLFDTGADILVLAGFLIVFAAFIMFMVQLSLLLRNHFCNACPNYSCPMNRVPEHVIEEFLKKNPAMEKARKKPAG